MLCKSYVDEGSCCKEQEDSIDKLDHTIENGTVQLAFEKAFYSGDAAEPCKYPKGENNEW